MLIKVLSDDSVEITTTNDWAFAYVDGHYVEMYWTEDDGILTWLPIKVDGVEYKLM